ncbi:MAG: DNA-directed RNA polymerase subunit beta [SAR324 cluster bacterium]|uniref:DNA-directed RNA polymerase subunit beta n=1 Tax=SAR324 cluster bacterium TaxID=2024889 RepID=A0A7X9ILJ4_9DELT|nr:DNA-directed RNA polymerase subunit beta [SAR324 cluster bacterium]
MTSKIKTNLRLRHSYSKIHEVAEIPNLIAIQKRSYDRFLQMNVDPEKREDIGLQKVFKSVFPIKDYNNTASLEFVNYSFGVPKYDVNECRDRGMTWAAPLRVTIQLVLWDVDPETGNKSLSALKEDVVYFGEIPLMTDRGTFMVNGTERVVVSQLHRSPGVFFDHDNGKSHVSGKLLYNARIIPYRGSWIDLEFDIKDILHVRIDRRRKLNATVLLRSLGMSSDDILSEYYKIDTISFGKRGQVVKEFHPDQLEGQKAFREIKSGGKTIVRQGGKFNRAVVRRLKEAGIDSIEIDPDSVPGMISADTIIRATEDIRVPKSGELIAEEGEVFIGWEIIKERIVPFIDAMNENDGREATSKFEIIIYAGEELTADKVNAKGEVVEQGNLSYLRELGIDSFRVLYMDDHHIGDALWKTLMTDKLNPEREDLYARLVGKPTVDSYIEIYRRLRPGDPPRPETASAAFKNLFFNAERYDLSDIGRYKINHKLYYSQGKEPPAQSDGTLSPQDIIETIRYIFELRNSTDAVRYSVDDIDHLGNRRVRAVGELIENQFRVGLVRMERAVRERMGMQDVDTLVPQDLINYKPVAAVVKEFFGSSQLSQFMDQTNPLSEITHKRRLSALGPGGLTRDRAGFEVRDVNPTHYGRICPIETPEGPNIGLIASLSVYARVNEYGFLETPYRVVDNLNRVTGDIVYLSALEEERETIAQAGSPIGKDGRFSDYAVPCRRNTEYVLVAPTEVTKMDVSPKQVVSVAASLIPFLENDDANRALMGSNMQRQAVPCLCTDAPLVGTGMERIVARDSKATHVAKRSGRVVAVDAERIVIRADKATDDALDTGVDIYNLIKYRRSNQNTCINQRPIVRPGEWLAENEVIADGPSTDLAELALVQNVVVAFMPWGGYNFEDSILISENLVKKDWFTSIHIEEFECVARDTKLGKEEITRDIPNVGEDALKNLDESGIIRIGAEVQSGDILVGKITPKSETQLSPEEKLLRAIFGEKAGEVRDTSLKLPPGVEGTIIAAEVFSRKGTDKDERTLALEKQQIERLEQDYRDEVNIIRDAALKEILECLVGKKTTARLVDDKRNQLIAKDTELTAEMLRAVPFEYLRDIQIGDEAIQERINRVVVRSGQLINNKRAYLNEKINRLKEGDELAPGVIKMVKVFVAIKRKIQVGDKMAGRHGNKGVLSRVLPQEDMPYLEDGTPVDVILNPLGVPSRMNVGQILETHLGWAAWLIGRNIRKQLEEVMDPETGVFHQAATEEQKKQIASAVREILMGVFKQPDNQKFIRELSDQDVLTLGRREMKGVHLASAVFDAASEDEIRALLKFAGADQSGQVTLYDGRSGEAFSEKVTVGVMYMLKLDHLVDDKIHARSIGPYSLVTQQPLGGKAQFGGQRLGEMEVWALEAYGAAYTLQEFLTVKSDDVAGRTRMYESIVKGEHVLEPGLPESFNVMMKELQSLGLDVELIEDGGEGVARTVPLEEIQTEEPAA